ncbi:proteasome activator pa28 REG alpha/beta subunit [Auriscalpium vulgare]|uniref:Proteasome activator pa28 REG alpha/beta subunit n=1 Tax=Auriscalpium vulgare TaxID=40419 RepID=A0ACB8SBZ3_9AGAM|nr:proteasome activator pa28 REG alpha/beta subunit [Auriscalpium vulgare]
MGAERKLDDATAKKLEDFRNRVAAEADDVIFRSFPTKDLISSTSSPSSPFHISHASTASDATVYPPPKFDSTEEPDTKKRKRGLDATANGASDTQHARYPNLVISNKALLPVQDTLKRECEHLVDLCDKVKLWINLTMPKIEDGDNFGVQIQEEVLNELHRSQESTYNMRDSARQSHINRAKLCSKIIKYPHIEDYTLALKEHDEKQLYLARQHLFDLRNIYAVMTDILHKNMTKLRVPKANNGVGLY